MILDLSKSIDQFKAKTYFEKLMKDQSKVEIKKFHRSKTYSQIKYLYVCYKILTETGYTVDEIKHILKEESGFMTYRKGERMFYVSAADLDTAQMTKYIDFIRAFGQDHGYYIPTPDEYRENEFELMRQYG